MVSMAPNKPSSHLIALSALAGTLGGIVRPIRLAVEDYYEFEAGRLFDREIYGFGNLLRLISVVALFAGCATMAMFFRMLLIWDCST